MTYLETISELTKNSIKILAKDEIIVRKLSEEEKTEISKFKIAKWNHLQNLRSVLQKVNNYVKDIFDLFISATKIDTEPETYFILDYAFNGIDKKIEGFLNIDEKTMKSAMRPPKRYVPQIQGKM